MNYAELANRLYGKPHLATPSLLKTASYLIENEFLQIKQKPIASRKDDVYIKNGVGYVEVKGTLVDEESWLDTECGITSYEKLTGEFEYLIVEQGLKEIVMLVNSGGGEAYGAFEGAEYVRSLADQHGAKITAYVDKIAASGGHVWASIAHEIVANAMSEVGSIGVVVQLYNDSEFLKQNGYERVFVYSGDQKIPFNDDGSFKQEFIDDIQKGVTETFNIFTNHVSKYRNISVDSIVATQARVFSAADALQLGLIDRIESRPSFRSSLETQRSKETKMGYFTKPTVDSQETDISISELQETNQNLSTQLAGIQSQLTIKQEEIAAYLIEKADLAGQIEQLKSVVAQYETEKLEKIKADRIAKISAVVDQDSVEALYASTETLNDDQFTVVLSTLGAKQETKREEFQELGFGSKADEAEVVSGDFGKSLAQHIINKKKGK